MAKTLAKLQAHGLLRSTLSFGRSADYMRLVIHKHSKFWQVIDGEAAYLL